MNADALDTVFGTGFSNVKEVKFDYKLNRPAKKVTDANADVQEQDFVVDATFDQGTGCLTISESAQGGGLWIPYLGNGSGGDGDKGWGTYSRAVNVAQQTWVATGKFSGCSIGKFNGAGGTRFAHLITPAAGHPCAGVNAQATAIAAATALNDVITFKPQIVAGEAIAFMLYIGGGWCKRVVQMQVGSTKVAAIGARSTPIT